MSDAFRFCLMLGLVLLVGCSDKKSPVEQPTEISREQGAVASDKGFEVPPADEDRLDLTVSTGDIEMLAYELDPGKILADMLPAEKLEEGWVRLFDGHTLMGWSIMGNADWRCQNGVIRVTRGDPSFLVSNFDIADYELMVDFRAAADTNSGIFMRTAPEPGDVSLDCLELNIAPPDNPYPTGSIVKREKLDPSKLGDFDPTQWHTFHVRLEGETVQVSLDGKQVLETVDDTSSRRGFISLQHNQGIVEFRNVLLRPINAQTLKLDQEWQQDWVTDEKEAGALKVEATASGLHIQGGLGKVQSKESFGDFWLQAKYSLAKPEVNSGIFFRCIEDSMLDGYECQVNHATVDDNVLQPKDSGAGAIFRRKPARFVVGDGTKPTYLSLLATRNQMITWVNGIMTTDFLDDRPADANPRKGTRTEAGPIALQGHDPTTDATFQQIKVSTLR